MASKPEDEFLTDEFLTDQLTPEFNFLAETHQLMPIQPDDLSLRSFMPSDTSTRWSWSSFVDSTKSFSGDFYRSDQDMNLSATSLGNSSKCHDSIGSVLSEAYDLDFLASYDPITSTFIESKTNDGWEQDDSRMQGDLLNDSFFPIGNTVACSNTSEATKTLAPGPSNASAFEQSGPWTFMDCSQGNDEASMNWGLGYPTDATPGDLTHGQEIIPLTEVQRETLIKWWGKDRFTEESQSSCRRSSGGEGMTSSDDQRDMSGGDASLRGNNALVSKTKGSHIPPPFRKGLWRSSSSGKQKEKIK